MKKSILTGTLLAVLACTGCTAEKAAETTPAEPTAEAAAEEVPAELEGTYYEQIAGRGSFVLFRTDTGAIWMSSGAAAPLKQATGKLMSHMTGRTAGWSMRTRSRQTLSLKAKPRALKQ